MSISKKIRFEVFKRDNFTCQYCGRKPPKVTLEIDHIVSKFENGTDEIYNLITSCYDCNRGKGKRKIDKISRQDIKKDIESLKERQKQIKQYEKLKLQEKTKNMSDLEDVVKYWLKQKEEVVII